MSGVDKVDRPVAAEIEQAAAVVVRGDGSGDLGGACPMLSARKRLHQADGGVGDAEIGNGDSAALRADLQLQLVGALRRIDDHFRAAVDRHRVVQTMHR